MQPDKNFNQEYFRSNIYKNYKSLADDWVPLVAKKIYRFFNRSSIKLLDIGCAHGYLMAELQNKYHFLVQGIDCSFYAVRNAEKSVKAKIKKGNILKTAFGENSFDAVVCFDVVNYLTGGETVEAIKKMIDISRTHIFFCAIFRHSKWASRKVNPDKLRISTLPRKEYLRLFNENGARLVSGFWAPNGGEILVFKKKK